MQHKQPSRGIIKRLGLPRTSCISSGYQRRSNAESCFKDPQFLQFSPLFRTILQPLQPGFDLIICTLRCLNGRFLIGFSDLKLRSANSNFTKVRFQSMYELVCSPSDGSSNGWAPLIGIWLIPNPICKVKSRKYFYLFPTVN